MTKASNQAYTDPNNKKRRIALWKIIFNMFQQTNGQYTTREVSKILGINYRSCQKRISDLLNMDLIMICGEKLEGGNPNSIYALNRFPILFKSSKRGRFELLRDALRRSVDSDTYDAIIDEYNRLRNLNKKK